MKQINRITFLISFLFLLGGASFAQISPFAEGYWVKVAIKESGVYKLPFDTLRAWGFDDPEHIGVYGYSWRDFSFKEDTIRKMQEIPLQTHAIGDSSFYSLYLEGVIRNEYSNNIKFTNPYNSKQSAYYYYIKQNASDTPPLSIDTLDLNNGTDSLYWDFGYNAYTHLIDNKVGYSLDSQTYIFQPKINYLDYEYKVDSLMIDIKNSIRVTVQHPEGTDVDTFLVLINDSLRYEMPISNFDHTMQQIDLPYIGCINKVEILAKGNSSFIKLKSIDIGVFVPYKYNSISTYLRQIQAIHTAQTGGISIAYNDEQPSLLSIKDRLIATIIKPHIEDGRLTISETSSTNNDFYLYNPKKLLKIDTVIYVPKTDLLSLEPCEYLLITTDSLFSEGVRLAHLHQEYDNLSTHVVRASDIYNLYTGGRIFAEGIYHFCKQMYFKGEVSGKRLKYVVLLGGGSEVSWYFDEKYCIPVSVPEYCGDAFAGVLEDTITYPKEIMNKSTMNVAVGRIPARTREDAKIYIDKVERKCKSFKKSNLEYLFIADKYDEGIELSFIDDLEPFALRLSDNQLGRVVHKEYLDNSSMLEESEMNMITHINNGVGMVCYYGHSSYNSWNHNLLDKEEILKLENNDLPLVFSASCAYATIGVHDDCVVNSWLFNPIGGAIAVIGFSNNTAISTGKEYLKCFQEAYSKNEDCSYGEQYRIAWNCYSGIWKRLVYLGDPAVWAQKPKNTINLTKKNDNEIFGQFGNSNFDEGLASIKVYHQPKLNATIAKEPEIFSISDSVIYNFTIAITDGQFSFPLPDDIINGFEGKILVYAISNDSTLEALGTAKLSSMISNTPSSKEINVYPIPFSSHLNISSECLKGENVSILIYGVDGTLVYHKLGSYYSGKTIISTEQMPSGYYILVIESDLNTSIQNITKID